MLHRLDCWQLNDALRQEHVHLPGELLPVLWDGEQAHKGQPRMLFCEFCVTEKVPL